MDQVFGLRLHYRNILGLYLYWIGLEPLLRRKEVFPYVGKLFSGLLILLDSLLFGGLGPVHMCVLVWTLGLVANGGIAYLFL